MTRRITVMNCSNGLDSLAPPKVSLDRDLQSSAKLPLQTWQRPHDPSGSAVPETPNQNGSVTLFLRATRSLTRKIWYRSSTRCCAEFAWRVPRSRMLRLASASPGPRSMRRACVLRTTGWAGCFQSAQDPGPGISFLSRSWTILRLFSHRGRDSEPAISLGYSNRATVCTFILVALSAHWRAAEKKTPIDTAPVASPRADLAEAYEVLRRRALAGDPEASGGLAILLAHGVGAWAEVCSTVLPEPVPRQVFAMAPPVLDHLASALIHAMTQMVLCHTTEERA